MGERRTNARLIVVCGLPGAGKTSYAKELEKKVHAIRFCPDEWMSALRIDIYDSEGRERIEALQWKLTQDLLVLGVSAIIEWGTWGRAERDVLRAGARALGVAVELHFIDAPIEVLFDRIQRRGQECPPIERADLEKWAEIFERPSPEEMALFDEPSGQS